VTAWPIRLDGQPPFRYRKGAQLPVRMLSSRCSPLVALTTGALLLITAPQASQALLVYSATGSSISGSLGGVAFTDANWSLSATADEALAQTTTFTMGPGTFNLRWLPVMPRLKIETMASVLEADLLTGGNFRWLALSGLFPVPPSPKIGFVYTTPMFQPETAAGVYGVTGSFVSLQSPISFTGPSVFEANTYPSSAGDLVITASPEVQGTFRVEHTPGPLPAMAAVGAFSWSRRLRARLGRRAG
jgi:hypothetical protein